MEERPCVPRDTRSISDAWHDFSLRVARNPSPFPRVSREGVTRGPDVGQGETELLSTPPPYLAPQWTLLALCPAGLSLHRDSRAETPGNLVLIRVIKSCPAAVAFMVNPGS